MPTTAREASPPITSAAVAAEAILFRQASSHRLASYGEIREHHTRQRWWVRRWLLVLMLFLAACPVNHGFYIALVSHQVITVPSVVAQFVNWTTFPLQVLRAVAWSTDFPPIIAAMQTLDVMLDGVEGTCDYAVQVTLGKRSPPNIRDEWFIYAVPLLLLGGYAVSPGPVWWGFRLFAIELMAQVYALMECLYAPLAWLVDRSRTAREFYEAYYDGMEWID